MVHHEILTWNFEHYGVRDIAMDWFCSYLANIKQFVSVNNHNTKFKQSWQEFFKAQVKSRFISDIRIHNDKKCNF